MNNPIDKKRFEDAVEFAVSRFWRWRGCTTKFSIVELEVEREYPTENVGRVMEDAKDRYYAEKLR